MGLLVVLMLLGAGFFAYVMASFNSTIADYNDFTSGSDNLAELHIWLNSVSRVQDPLPNKIKKRIISHFLYYWKNDRLKALANNYWEENST
jgi:hypothetical protein